MARMMRKKPARRAKRRGRKVPRRRNKKAGLRPSKQYATIVETVAVGDVFSDQPYQFFFSLSQFYRATTIAKNFMFYRAKTVKWEYMPLYNTYQANTASLVPNVGKPQFYMQMNRTGDVKYASYSAVDGLFSMQCAGTDPSPLVGNREIVYRPNWCSPGLIATSQTVSPLAITQVVQLGSKPQYGWLPTPNRDAWATPNSQITPVPPTGLTGLGYNTVDIFPAGAVYNGHNIYIQQSNEPNLQVAKVICTVEWEFKGGKQLYAPPIENSAVSDVKA